RPAPAARRASPRARRHPSGPWRAAGGATARGPGRLLRDSRLGALRALRQVCTEPVGSPGLDQLSQISWVDGVPKVTALGASAEVLPSGEPHVAREREELDAAWVKLLRVALFRSVRED